ncbi:MAG: glutathione S-transferase [Gammaproteobacteria bacterium]|jgi:glutathione S-transferase
MNNTEALRCANKMSPPQYPILYSFRRCPYAMRARMALMQASIACELREVVLRNKPASMLALSSKGTVPVLRLPSGQVIDESLDVMRWALGRSDPHAWLSADDAMTKDLIERNDSSFKADLDHYKYYVEHPEHSQQHYRGRAENFLSSLEDLLTEHQGIALLGQQLSLADIALFPFVRQFARVDEAWFSSTHYEHLKQWLKRHEQSRLFLSVMNKYPAWASGHPATIFGGARQSH